MNTREMAEQYQLSYWAGILREIRDLAQKLQTVTGVPVKPFRVPSGAYHLRVIEHFCRDKKLNVRKCAQSAKELA